MKKITNLNTNENIFFTLGKYFGTPPENFLNSDKHNRYQIQEYGHLFRPQPQHQPQPITATSREKYSTIQRNKTATKTKTKTTT